MSNKIAQCVDSHGNFVKVKGENTQIEHPPIKKKKLLVLLNGAGNTLMSIPRTNNLTRTTLDSELLLHLQLYLRHHPTGQSISELGDISVNHFPI